MATFSLPRALPKVELHAHLSGSIKCETLHQIWQSKKLQSSCQDLDDPMSALKSDAASVDIISFFSIFDRYIYKLLDTAEAVRFATKTVLEDFQADGVAYLELRTTPRENPATGLTKQDYVETVNSAVSDWEQQREVGEHAGTSVRPGMETRLILSIDRKMTVEQAEEVVDLALAYRRSSRSGYVVGVDLCGNPAKGDIRIFTHAFQRAKSNGLGITLHFAEIPKSSTDQELDSLLSWQPDRLGHIVCVSEAHKAIIRQRKIGLELCLSCNVIAKMSQGGFANHHLGEWMQTECPIALSVSWHTLQDRHYALIKYRLMT
jgi:adenosine deaminase